MNSGDSLAARLVQPSRFPVSFRVRAQGLVEYALIISLVAVLAIAGLIVFGPIVGGLLSRLVGSV